MAKEVKKIKTFLHQANQRGSILAFSLIIMFVLMIIAVGVATVSVKERKISSTTGKSITAYQAADSGAEKILQARKDNPTDSLTNIADSVGGVCAGGEISGTAALGNYIILFYDGSGNKINNCGDGIDTVVKIKSSGSYAGTTRAVEVDL